MLERAFTLGVACALTIVGGLFAADDGPRIKPIIPTDSVQFARALSQDGMAGTLIFDNLQVATEIGRGSLPSVETKQFTYVLQLESTKGVVVTQDIRGFVSTQAPASAALLIHAGGKTTTVDLKKAIESYNAQDKGKQTEHHAKARKLADEQGYEGDQPDKSDNFFVRIKTELPAGRPLQTTVVLLVDRVPGDDGSGALLTIDTIDFEIAAAAEKK